MFNALNKNVQWQKYEKVFKPPNSFHPDVVQAGRHPDKIIIKNTR